LPICACTSRPVFLHLIRRLRENIVKSFLLRNCRDSCNKIYDIIIAAAVAGNLIICPLHTYPSNIRRLRLIVWGFHNIIIIEYRCVASIPHTDCTATAIINSDKNDKILLLSPRNDFRQHHDHNSQLPKIAVLMSIWVSSKTYYYYSTINISAYIIYIYINIHKTILYYIHI